MHALRSLILTLFLGALVGACSQPAEPPPPAPESAPERPPIPDGHTRLLLRLTGADGQPIPDAFGEEHAQRIRDYIDAKPKGKFGTHRYSPEDWGFERAAVREQTRAYVEAHGVELED